MLRDAVTYFLGLGDDERLMTITGWAEVVDDLNQV